MGRPSKPITVTQSLAELKGLHSMPPSKRVLLLLQVWYQFVGKKIMQYDKQTQEHMLEMVSSWKQSGLSQKAFCEQNNIRYYVFHYWYKRYRDRSSCKPTGFVQLEVERSSSHQCFANIEVVLADGKRILFHQPVSSDYLKSVIS